MNLQLIAKGSRFTIYAIDFSDTPDQSSCPIIEFLNELKISEPISYKSMINVLQRHANNGPLANIQKSRRLRGAEELFEFKNRQGARILYFYPGNLRYATILTHGFKKGANIRTEIGRAERIQTQYYEGLTE